MDIKGKSGWSQEGGKEGRGPPQAYACCCIMHTCHTSWYLLLQSARRLRQPRCFCQLWVCLCTVALSPALLVWVLCKVLCGSSCQLLQHRPQLAADNTGHSGRVSAMICAASAAGLRCLCQAPPLVSSDRFQVKATARHSTAFNCPCPDAGVSCLAVVCGCWLVVVWLGSGCWSSARCLGLHSALLCQSLFMCRRFLVDGNLSIHPHRRLLCRCVRFVSCPFPFFTWHVDGMSHA